MLHEMAVHALQPEIGRDDKAKVLTKAFVRAADELGLTQKDMAEIVGVSEATISRMRKGTYTLSGKSYQFAVCVVRIFRSLDAIVGSDAAAMHGWVRNHNTDLADVPRRMMMTVNGLVDVMNYLDAQRAPL